MTELISLTMALHHAMVLAQASSTPKWLAPVLILVVLVGIVLIAMASRRGGAEDVEDLPKPPTKVAPPRAEDAPTTNLEELREQGFDPQELEAILARPPETWTIRDRKVVNIARKRADSGLSERINAIERTAKERAEHEELEDPSATAEEDPSEAQNAPLLVKTYDEEEPPEQPDPLAKTQDEEEKEDDQAEEDETSMAQGLSKTRNEFSKKFFGLFKGKETIDDDLRDHIEEFLYTADIGSKAARRIIRTLDEKLRDDVKKDPKLVWEFVRSYITDMLRAREGKLDIETHTPFVILVIGVNGAGKTTTIGKLASTYKRQGKSVLIVAGDTFRAAAVEQLEVWANRVNVPFHRGKDQADPGSVIYSGIERAVEEHVDVVLCDTSGRLHNNVKLMDELRRIPRVSDKALPGSPHETILVLDANSGQNAVQQAKIFGEALDVTGLVLTKLDGTARGGIILGIGEEVKVPVRYIGIGEGIRDLREYDAEEFADALFL